MTDTMLATPVLLKDQEVIDFIINGYMLVELDFPPEFHQSVCDQIDAVFERRGNPLDDILDEVPDLHKVYNHPKVRGAFISLLGEDYQMNSHRHCHYSGKGAKGGHWHQDSLNVRHHRIMRCLGMYYPQDVTEDMGPTVVLPGTQYHNTPSSLMASYMNFRDQVPLTVKAGTVAITHYDIWHAWMDNRSDKHRRMLKFLFDRVSEPTGPTWDADPEAGLYVGVGAKNLPIDDMTAAYKHRRLWADVWRWLHGEPTLEY